jgi:hypothetical protein
MVTFLCTAWPHLVRVGDSGVQALPFSLYLPPPLELGGLLHPHPTKTSKRRLPLLSLLDSLESTEPVFLNAYGAQESIPRNEFRQSIAWRAGPITLFLLGF